MKKRKEKKNCYKCDELATSREHIPPLCLFPEEKDIKTSIFRNNLITVPSCDLHNSKKSKDDEFNVIGLFHTFTKVKRSLERKGKDFINILMKDSQNINFENKGGYKFPVLVGRPDFNRLHSCFQHIACGLFYYKFGRRIDGECHVLIDFLTYDNERMETYKLLCRKRTEVEPNKPKIEGANPEIFQYEFLNQMNSA